MAKQKTIVLLISIAALILVASMAVFAAQENAQEQQMVSMMLRMDKMIERCEKMMGGDMGKMMSGMGGMMGDMAGMMNSSGMGSGMMATGGMSMEEHLSHHPELQK